jgi:hypothetical protein
VGTTIYIGHGKFFRIKLLALSTDEIERLVESYEKQANGIKEDALKLSWYMRGAVSYEHALMMSSSEREMIGKIIKDNLETTKKSGLPFF